jgi:predicted metal-dependent phosphoesterase TrpH
MIDLHVHSIFSDGSQTPEELLAEAEALGLKALGLTDHDTVRGIDRFLAAAPPSVRPVPGVEVSTRLGEMSPHMLGYFVDPSNRALGDALAWIRESRQARNMEILAKLNRMGFQLSWEEVRQFAGDEVVGRPHFALAMVRRGYVKDRQRAFRDYLGHRCPAYVERKGLSPEESIALIRGAGGVAVLAHPVTLKLLPNPLRDLLSALRDEGLGGVEVYYPEHPQRLVNTLLKMAADLGLAVTGGSDYHGDMSPHLKLGRGFGSLNVPDHVVDRLAARRPGGKE